MKPAHLSLLRESARHMGIHLGEKELDQFDRYTALMRKWSRKISLTSIREEREIVIRLILDSLLLHDRVQDSWFVMDIGSGQGCPGIPLKIVRPSLRIILLESRGKKVSFLKTAIRELALKDCQAIQQRAEDRRFQRALKGQLDAVMARAVAETSRMVRIGMPYLKPSGSLFLMKGSRIEQELERAHPVMEKMGAKIESIEELSIPQTDWTSKLITIAWS
jgi:16S rRNA (guanine527-N7)-methyltransferase